MSLNEALLQWRTDQLLIKSLNLEVECIAFRALTLIITVGDLMWPVWSLTSAVFTTVIVKWLLSPLDIQLISVLGCFALGILFSKLVVTACLQNNLIKMWSVVLVWSVTRIYREKEIKLNYILDVLIIKLSFFFLNNSDPDTQQRIFTQILTYLSQSVIRWWVWLTKHSPGKK